jgi:hypothetical protein
MAILPGNRAIVAGTGAPAKSRGEAAAVEPWPLPLISRTRSRQWSMDVSRGKMKGDDSGKSKRGQARGSGGTTQKSQDPGKQDNNKAQNTKSNKQ